MIVVVRKHNIFLAISLRLLPPKVKFFEEMIVLISDLRTNAPNMIMLRGWCGLSICSTSRPSTIDGELLTL